MSENEQQNVSRETARTPIEARRGGSAGDPPEDVSRETSVPLKKGKGSSFFIYLAVLFGAAFLMLLLAYFVQQRNSDAALDNLRMTSNASKEELLEELQALEAEREELEAQIRELELDLKQEQSLSQDFQALYDGARTSAAHLEYTLLQRTQAMELLWQLERAYAQRDYDTCQAFIHWLEMPEANPRKDFLPTEEDREQYDYGLDGSTPAERYQEIVEKLS